MFNLVIPNISFHSVELPLKDELRENLEHKWITISEKHFAAKRIESFVAGRFCAEKSLESFEVELKSLPMDESGRPLWPSGISGSISHTKTLAVAAVSRKFKSVGIDVEELIEAQRVDRISSVYINVEERKLLEINKSFYGTLIFSAKESLFKLINPLCCEYFGFSHADLLSCDLDKGTFAIELKSDNPKVSPFNKVYSGNYYLERNNIITVLAV